MTRRFPNRRHVDIDLGPERVRRKNLNRVSISIAVIFALLVLASPFLQDLATDSESPAPPAPTATAPGESNTPAAGAATTDTAGAETSTATASPTVTPATATPTADAGAAIVPVEGAVTVDVVEVIDGDTLDVHSAQTELRVRLFGVNTPERGEACFEEASERLAALAGEQVQLLPDVRLTDPYGRELRYVYALDGTLIGEQLVAEGLGYAWTRDGQFRAEIMATEAEARAGGVGCLWGD